MTDEQYEATKANAAASMFRPNTIVCGPESVEECRRFFDASAPAEPAALPPEEGA